jgi:histidine ammonia-lyase
VREVVSEMVEDRPLYLDIEAARKLIERRALIEVVEAAVGALL